MFWKCFKNKKIVSLFMAVFMLVTTLLFVCFIIKESTHECTHNECTVCYDIGVAKDIVKNKVSYVIAAFIVAFTFIYISKFSYAENIDNIKNTLVSLKIELLN